MDHAEIAERIGRMSDTCSNLLAATMLPGLPASIHVVGLTGGVKSLRSELNAIYRELGGTEDLEGDGP